MSQKTEVKTEGIEELVIPKKVSVFEDKRTRAKTLALPFTFPDGKNGVVMVARLYGMSWNPSDQIEKIAIHFKKKE